MDFQFYVVWSPQSGNPMVQHDDPRVAAAEAERLANANPGRRFYVLKALRYAQKVTAAVVELPPLTNRTPF